MPSLHYDIPCSILAMLMTAPRTRRELRQAIGTRKETVNDWINVLRGYGLIYVCAYEVPVGRSGQPAEIFNLQTTPYEHPDAVLVVARKVGHDRAAAAF